LDPHFHKDKHLVIFLVLAYNCYGAIHFFQFEDIYSKLIGAGAVFGLLALIFSGIKFLIAGGDPNKIAEAKSWLRGAILGLIIIGAAGSIYEIITNQKISFDVSQSAPMATVSKESPNPGIILYSEENCPKNKETSSPPIKSIKIINSNKYQFKAIFKNYTCQVFLNPGCHNLDKELQIDNVSSYQYIFNPDESGWITFYEKPYFYGKKYTLCLNSSFLSCDKKINKDEIENFKISELPFYPNSFRIKGYFIVVAFDNTNRCEIFEQKTEERKDILEAKNLKSIFPDKNHKIEKITIFSAK